MCALLLLGAAVFYLLFGTAERQYWADPLGGGGSSYYQRETDTATVDTGSSIRNGATSATQEVDGAHGDEGFRYRRWNEEPEESDLGARTASASVPATSEPQVYGAGSAADGELDERRKIRPDEADPRPYSATDAR